MSNAIVWFKNDLRLRDNEMLSRACKSHEKILPVFIFDPRQFDQLSSLNFHKTGPFKAQFLIESVHNLRKSLKAIGGDLIVRVGFPELIIPELAERVKANKVYWTKEVSTEELHVVHSLEQILEKQGIICDQIWQSTLFHEEDVPWPIRQVPQIFTTFRKEVEKESAVRELVKAPDSIQTIAGIDHGEIPTVEALGLERASVDNRAYMQFKGGEEAAWGRLNEYIWQKDLLKVYKNTRNNLLGADYSSKLSPWLAVGCISAKSIYYEIKQYESERKKNKSTYWLYFELMWRDFFHFMTKQNGAAIFQLQGMNGEPPEMHNNRERFHQWQYGKTGEPFVDANMKELLFTGFMSNRGRQNVASYLIYDLQVNWTWGAAWFENRLIDYDPCSNWLNWAYVAGVGNDPRNGRHFNIESQQQRYDPKSEYINYWLS